MRFEDLSYEDQQLVSTNFPEALEKEAAAEVEIASELYEVGFSKLAAATAEEMEEGTFKLAADEDAEEKEEEKEEEEADEEEVKEAQARAAFIARGYIDGLMKEGQARHGDWGHYIAPLVEARLEKKAAAAPAAVSRALGNLANKAKKHNPYSASAVAAKSGGSGSKSMADRAKALADAKDVTRKRLRNTAIGGVAAVPVAYAAGKKRSN